MKSLVGLLPEGGFVRRGGSLVPHAIGRGIHEVVGFQVDEMRDFLGGLDLGDRERLSAGEKQLLAELKSALGT